MPHDGSLLLGSISSGTGVIKMYAGVVTSGVLEALDRGKSCKDSLWADLENLKESISPSDCVRGFTEPLAIDEVRLC